MPEAGADECPTSILSRHPELRWLADRLGRERHLRDGFGCSLGGGDSARLPAWWVDALATYTLYRKYEDAARTKRESEIMNSQSE